MKASRIHRYLPLILISLLLVFTMPLASCTVGQGPSYFDAGAGNISLTGTQFAKYNFIRFDTSAGERTLTLPSASDLVSAASPSAADTFLVFIVAADGANAVKIIGGTSVTVKPSATVVQANSAVTLYCVFTNVNGSSAAVIIY